MITPMLDIPHVAEAAEKIRRQARQEALQERRQRFAYRWARLPWWWRLACALYPPLAGV